MRVQLLLLSSLGLLACDVDPDPGPVDSMATSLQAAVTVECGDDTRPWVQFDPLAPECPAAGSCLWINHPGDEPREFTLRRDCSYDGMEFLIQRSNVTLDCNCELGADGTCAKPTMRGSGHGIAIQVIGSHSLALVGEPMACGVAPPEVQCDQDLALVLHDVTVRNCFATGYEGGGLVRFSIAGRGTAARFAELFRKTYLEWVRHPNELACRMSQMEDCLRAAAPHDIRFENVHLRDQRGNGLHIFSHVHDVVFSRGSVIGNGNSDTKSVGIYMSPGSQNNTIENSTISGNYREGIAMDASANNIIRGNVIADNSDHWWDDWEHLDLFNWSNSKADYYGVGITIFKNAWEQKTPEEGPRPQHATGNQIIGNKIKGHEIGVWIGYRQGKVRAAGKRHDPVYYSNGDDLYYKKYAEDNEVTDNDFVGAGVGVLVQDDSARIVGNRFSRGAYKLFAGGQAFVLKTNMAISIGHDVRRGGGEPVRGAVVSGNLISPWFKTAIYQRDCTFDNSFVDNHIAPTCLTPETCTRTNLTPVAPPAASCGRKQARIVSHIAGADGALEVQSRLRSGAFFSADQTWLAGDFDADGMDDLVNAFITTDGRARLWLHKSYGRGFDYQSSFQTFEVAGANGKWVAGNFDGKAGVDVLYVVPKGTAPACHYQFRAFGVGFQQVFKDCMPLGNLAFDANHRWLSGDYDDDGWEDMIQIHGDATGRAHIVGHRSQAGILFDPAETELVRGAFSTADQWLSGDWNGDGSADVLRVGAGVGGAATTQVFRSIAGNFQAAWTQQFTGSSGAAFGYWPAQRWLVTDLNGDGRDDIVFVYGRQGEARVVRYHSTGSQFVYQGIATLGAFSDEQKWMAGAFNGDDLGELAHVYPRTWPTD